jgi:hypothetical protein
MVRRSGTATSPLCTIQVVEIVEGPIPRLVTLTKGIRTLEMEIGRIRKSIKKLEKL